MRTRIWASIVVVAFVVPLLAAQVDFGAINGVVTDGSGAVLPGVTIELTGPEKRTVLTGDRGEFSVVRLRPGEYDVLITLAGFSTVRTKVVLAAGRTERLTIQMRLAALEETVTVTGETPRVNTQPAAAQFRTVVGGVIGGGVVGAPLAGAREGFNTESYDHIEENRFRRVEADPLSTFSIDVDTASYANVRRFITDGMLPPAGAIRIEELVNYFRFDYPQPSANEPFSITTELTPCPWNPRHRLALIGLQGRELKNREPSPRNLVFLIDVSGSMMPPDKLPLCARRCACSPTCSLSATVWRLSSTPVRAASCWSTTGEHKDRIHQALAQLEAGGSTNGASGIRLAYQVARENFIVGGVNRVILATDGDFNVGVTNQSELVSLIERERESGVFLSVLGVGTGNLKDSTMEKLADKGNGNYSYLDTVHEARKVLVREAGATLDTIAKDVKIQVEFNPRAVFAYRLIGTRTG